MTEAELSDTAKYRRDDGDFDEAVVVGGERSRMTTRVTPQLTSWLMTFEIALHLSADTAWRSMLMQQIRNVRVSYALNTISMNELRERNIEIAAELALATCNCAITVRRRDPLIRKSTDERMI